MRLSQVMLSSTLILAAAVPAFGYMHARRGPTSSSMFKKRSLAKTAHGSHTLGPRAMDSERATQIQEALIKNGYLSGTPTGKWDAESESAMQKLQGSKGWQTKLTPDSRALILLGLGPKQDAESTPSSALETSALVTGTALTK